MAEFYGNKVGHWSVYTTCDVNQQNNGAVQLHIQTYFQAWDQWNYRGLDAEYSQAVNGGNHSVYTDGGINVGHGERQQLLDDYVWVNRGYNAMDIPFNSHINVSGYAAGWSAGSGSISIGAKPSYTVSYDANGGSGAPGSQTRWWGEVINLSNTKPTRTNYEFLGWSTSAGGGVNYQPGSRYGEDASRTLYAVWKLSLVAPSLTEVTSWRSDASGVIQNDGTYVTVKASWSVDTAVDSNNSGMNMVVNDGSGDDTTTLSGVSGTYQKTFANKDIANSYTFTVTLTDKHMSVSATTMVGPAFFLLDINSTGTAIGIGQAAPASGLAVAGTYFATGDNQLPSTAATVGAVGSRAFVNGRMKIWNGSKWVPMDVPLQTFKGSNPAMPYESCTWWCCSGIVTMYLMWGVTGVSWDSGRIGSIPAEYAPPASVFMASNVQNNTTSGTSVFEVRSDGSIRWENLGGAQTADYHQATFSYGCKTLLVS